MIHKFDDIPADINTRKDVVVLVDEAHRTTGGDLRNYLVAALPNATYIGFTGTPIDNIAKGKGIPSRSSVSMTIRATSTSTLLLSLLMMQPQCS
jgi:type I site-specific restriction-modification system R (restriction) subunit